MWKVLQCNVVRPRDAEYEPMGGRWEDGFAVRFHEVDQLAFGLG